MYHPKTKTSIHYYIRQWPRTYHVRVWLKPGNAMIAPKMLPYLSERETGVGRTSLSWYWCAVRDRPGIADTFNCGSVFPGYHRIGSVSTITGNRTNRDPCAINQRWYTRNSSPFRVFCRWCGVFTLESDVCSAMPSVLLSAAVKVTQKNVSFVVRKIQGRHYARGHAHTIQGIGCEVSDIILHNTHLSHCWYMWTVRRRDHMTGIDCWLPPT
jgi:hypothetical protein